MKKFISLLAITMMAITMFAQVNRPARNIKEQVYTYDFQNNNGNWTAGEGANAADGDVNAPLIAGHENELSLTAIQGESKTPVRIMKNASKGIFLQCPKLSSLKFNVTEGKAITKIEVVMQVGSFDLVPTNGEMAENVWVGNASEVIFTNEKGMRYIWSIQVTVTERDENTLDPSPLTYDFTSADFRGYMGDGANDPDGWVFNESFVNNGLNLQITAGTAPSRVYADKNRGNCFVTYKEGTMVFRAPAGKAISKIEFTAAGNSSVKFTPTSGAIEEMTWTGNAQGLRLVNNGTAYLANVIVTLTDKDENTELIPAIEYTECADIAAFNALEDGTYAKLMLTDAEVTGLSADGISTMWIQDATAGTTIQYCSLIKNWLQENTKTNGFFYVVKRTASGNTQIKEAEDTPKSQFTAESFDEPTMIEGTIAEVNVPENLNRVVKITRASFVATSANAGKLTQDGAEINVNNGTETANQQLHKITDVWVKDETKIEEVNIVAILTAASASKNQLLPITMVDATIDGITSVQNHQEHVTFYNLQGVRRNQLQKGINIVNGKKIILK